MSKNTCSRIKDLRMGRDAMHKTKKRTQEELAEELKVDRGVVQRMEKCQMPNVEQLQALSEKFNVSIDYIINGKEWADEDVEDEAKRIAYMLRGLSKKKKKIILDILN